MNSCILMAKIISNPELRSTQDQVSVSSMMVEFESSREGEEPGKVQVEGWGNLAEEMKNTYSEGDTIIIEGRLTMNLFEMPEGYKEKRAKLVASKIYPLSNLPTNQSSANFTGQSNYQSSNTAPSNVVDFASTMQSAATPADLNTNAPSPATNVSQPDNNEDWDEIPF